MRKQVFDQLQKPVAYNFRDSEHLIHQQHPVVVVAKNGELTTVSWNNYDRAALPTDMAQREALRVWDDMLKDERWHVDFQLQRVGRLR